LKPYYNDLVVHRGTAFGFDGNILAAIDVATGDRAWKGGRYGNGQVLLLPDHSVPYVRVGPLSAEDRTRIKAILARARR
jgi:hypothetical protein